ncbi:MAG TPA: U32 family peptidase [Bacilli bacterium]|nr:U32 family peptidase [Bacilli bacterium]
MKKPELLAPAGNMECLKAAILAGCDAIYLGGYIFGARAFSNNFSNDELLEALDYAHQYGVKIYVTVNTLIYENEVETFINYVKFLYESNVDAVIVQDIGMMDLIRQTFPNLEVHASTQMHIHNLEGVKLVSNLGLKRAVLARETSIEDIKEIKKNCDIELEIFVHGALCISYSGQCLMSSLIGGRSGNRGTCAGSCRQKYDVLDNNMKKLNIDEYNLSTKDLNSLENIGQLIEANVDSLKIEGRMKSPTYVYLVTKLYRTAIDSYIENGKVIINKDDLYNLKKTFNRMFTKGFLFNEDNNNFINPYRPNHLGVEIGKVINVNNNKVSIKLNNPLNLNDGIRIIGNIDYGQIVTKLQVNNKNVNNANSGDIVTIYCDEKIQNNSVVVKTSDYLLNKEIDNLIKTDKRKILIDGIININKDKKIELTINKDDISLTEYSDNEVEKAIKIETTKEDVFKQINKTGNTIFEFNNINIKIDNNLFVPIKELNDLRRKALDKLLIIIKNSRKNVIYGNYKRDVIEYSKENITSIYIKELEQYNLIKNKNIDRIYVDNDIYDSIDDKRKVLKLPRVINKYNNYNEHMLVGELGSINKYKDIDTDFSLNIVNSYSVALLNSLGVKRITLSYELNDDQIKDIIFEYRKRYQKEPNLAIIVYGKEEIMISKFNLLKYYNALDKGYLRDRFNNLYKIIIKDNLMYIYNNKVLNKNNNIKYFNLGINEIRYNMVDEKELDF